jgi:hypothetical protein
VKLLEENKRINEINELYNKFKISDKVILAITPFIKDIMNELVEDNGYISQENTIRERFNSGKVWRWTNSIDLRIDQEYLSEMPWDNLIAKVSWYCEQPRYDKTKVNISIKVYHDSKHTTEYFNHQFDIMDIMKLEKAWFGLIGRWDLDKELIMDFIKPFRKQIREFIKDAIERKYIR